MQTAEGRGISPGPPPFVLVAIAYSVEEGPFLYERLTIDL